MPERATIFDAEIIHELPNEIATLVGHVIVSFARLEHSLSWISGLLMQLNKPEARIALRKPRATERLDMAVDLFAIKDIPLKTDTKMLRETISKALGKRDILAHSIWLRHPKTGELFVQLTRGQWPKDLSLGEKVSRAVFPQSIPFGPTDCREALDLISEAMKGVDALGAELDAALRAFPDRFREPSPVMNPLGNRTR